METRFGLDGVLGEETGSGLDGFLGEETGSRLRLDFLKRCQGPEKDGELEEETGSGNRGQNRIQIPSMWQGKIGLANFDQNQALLSFEDTIPWLALS